MGIRVATALFVLFGVFYLSLFVISNYRTQLLPLASKFGTSKHINEEANLLTVPVASNQKVRHTKEEDLSTDEMTSDQYVDSIMTNYKQFCSNLDYLRSAMAETELNLKALTAEMEGTPSVQTIKEAKILSRKLTTQRGTLILCLRDKINENNHKEKESE